MVGQNIGKYRVVDRVGRGGMGTVYRATDETLHREVAIKVLNAELNDPVVARRFRAEAVTVARLNHPGIATIYELFQHEGQWLMVMEFVRGETFEALVLRKGPLTVEEAAPLTMQALNALAHAHSLGIVHRDLKPANIMLNEAGVVKVMDFGIARVSGTEHLTSAGFLMGTPAYMAPEQVTAGEIDARADLYSMGCVLYHLVTGKLPFKGDTPFALAQSRIKDAPIPLRDLRQDLPPWLSQVMDLALARTPEQRIQSAPLFHEALRRGLAHLPLDTPAPGTTPPELIATAAPGSMPVIARPEFTPATGVKGSTPAAGTAPLATPGPPTPLPFQGSSGAIPVLSPSQVVQVPVPSGGATSATPPVSTPSSGLPLAARRADPAYDSAAVTMVSMPTPAVSPSAPVPTTGAVPASAPQTGALPTTGTSAAPPSGGRGLVIGAAAAIVVIGGIGTWMWMRSRAVPAPPTPTVSAPAPEAPPTTAAATPVGAPAVPAPETPSTPSAPVPVPTVSSAPATPAVGDAAARGRVATPPLPPGTTTARGRGRAATATRANDPIVAYGELKAIVVSGKKGDEQDVVLSFVAGQISIVAKRGGANLGTMSYQDLRKATYTRAKNPKWDTSLAAPPADLDLPGGLFRSARHWLVLQSPSMFFILRLNDGDFRAVMGTVHERTGVAVEQTSPSGL